MNQVVEYVQNGLALVPIPLGSKGPDKPGWNLPENAITTINGAESITGNAVKSAIKSWEQNNG